MRLMDNSKLIAGLALALLLAACESKDVEDVEQFSPVGHWTITATKTNRCMHPVEFDVSERAATVFFRGDDAAYEFPALFTEGHLVILVEDAEFAPGQDGSRHALANGLDFYAEPYASSMTAAVVVKTTHSDGVESLCHVVLVADRAE